MEILSPKLSARLLKGQILSEKQIQQNGPEAAEKSQCVLELPEFVFSPESRGHILIHGSVSRSQVDSWGVHHKWKAIIKFHLAW